MGPIGSPTGANPAWWKRRIAKLPVWLWIAGVVVVAAAASTAGKGDPDTTTDGAAVSTVAAPAAAGEAQPTAAPAEPAAAPATAAAPVAATLGVGGTDTTGDFSVTLHGFEDPVVNTDGISEPKPGNKFVAVELTITNTSNEPQPFSTLLAVELLDSQNQQWDVSVFGVSDRSSLDGDVPAGESRRGWIAFETPAASTGFRLQVKGNLTASGITFTLA